jgi:YidC/Oxa1 family membrane protein insertase
LKLSDQTRAIIAAALSLLVIGIWIIFFKPMPPDTSTQVQAPAGTSVAAGGGAVPGQASAPGAAPSVSSAAASGAIKAAAPVAAAADSAEKTFVVESDLYRVVISNRGGVVRSWQLKKYSDEDTPPHTLDLVHADAAQQSGGWPFSLQASDPQIENAANQGLYLATSGPAVPSTNEKDPKDPKDPKEPAVPASSATTIVAPATIVLHWSNGQLDVTKTLKFDNSYIVEVATSVTNNGQPVSHSVAWRGGFGDATAFRAAIATTVFTDQGGKITAQTTKNLGATSQHGQFAVVPGSFDAVGIQDLFFAVSFLPQAPPPGQPMPANLTLAARQIQHSIAGSTTPEVLPEMAAGTTDSGPLALRAFIGPKDLDMLKAIRPPLNGLVQFGWAAVIAEPLFYILRWVHRYIPNYGWAIVIVTVAINMLLYPLKVKSWRSMQKMQKVGPEIRAIQDRYKKYTMRDPRKADMNKEVMAVYSREGINPMGSCLPQLAQFPIWIALYRMLTVTIELRHAPWIFWVHDLSGRDPYFILTIAMAALMFVTQKMTPMPASDPSQQRMMALMPVIFGGMFIIVPVSSGLVLYIFTQQVVAIAQQWHLNRTSPLKALTVKKKGK